MRKADHPSRRDFLAAGLAGASAGIVPGVQSTVTAASEPRRTRPRPSRSVMTNSCRTSFARGWPPDRLPTCPWALWNGMANTFPWAPMRFRAKG